MTEDEFFDSLDKTLRDLHDCSDAIVAKSKAAELVEKKKLLDAVDANRKKFQLQKFKEQHAKIQAAQLSPTPVLHRPHASR